MNRLLYILFVLLSLYLVNANAGTTSESPEEESSAPASSTGVVLEFDDSEEAGYEERPDQQQDAKQEGIDFIIVGEGKDGVAKRGTLQVID